MTAHLYPPSKSAKASGPPQQCADGDHQAGRCRHQFPAEPAVQTLPRPEVEGALKFAETVCAIGLDPNCPWIGGYAQYEWEHLRPVLSAYGVLLAGARAFELGTNVGGSAVVMAALGAHVSAVDIDPDVIKIANANIAQHCLSDRAHASHVPDTRHLNFADGEFDFALANSVLEYVAPAHLAGVVAEVARVLRPGGLLLICGTASRLAPFADHEGKWGVNYIPTGADRITGKPLFRGLWPLALKRAYAPYFNVVAADRWINARIAVHGGRKRRAGAFAAAASIFGQPPGLFSPTIELLLQRRRPGDGSKGDSLQY